MQPAIEVADLSKRYGETVAVDGISFSVAAGAIFGLLGPNGAGKSTTIGVIAGLLAPSRGQVRVAGHDIVAASRDAKRALGVVPQELALYEGLSARQNLRYWGSAQGLAGGELTERVARTLDRIGLAGRADEPVEQMSGGMKRRLNFGCGVVHGPRVLLLDEPTVGVDPQSRDQLLDSVRHEAQQGTAVLYTTHYMEEAQALCDDLAIVDHGRVAAQGTLEALRHQVGERDLLRLVGTFDPPAVRALVTDPARFPVAGTDVLQADEGLVVLSIAEASSHLPQVLQAIAATGATLRETTLAQPSLETLFLRLTGRDLRE